MIGIRADANEEIASGHIMRCMAVAEELKKTGEPPVFITADEYPLTLLNERNFSSYVLQTDWRDMQSEIPKLEALFAKHRITALLLDSYQVTETYLHELSQRVNVIYLDDLAKFHYPVQSIVNYSFAYAEWGYEKEYAGSDTELFLGCDYIPLREEFHHNERKKIDDCIQKVMVTIGGADFLHLSGPLLEHLAKTNPAIQFHMVVGPFFQNQEELERLASQYGNICLHYHVKRMSELMRECDAAISAGGTTLYELCACGVPTLSFVVADNQTTLSGKNALADAGIMLDAGDARGSRESFLQRVEQQLEHLKEKEFRKELSEKMQQLVDGKGAERIADVIKGKEAGV